MFLAIVLSTAFIGEQIFWGVFPFPGFKKKTLGNIQRPIRTCRRSFTNEYHDVIVRHYIESNVDNKHVGIFFLPACKPYLGGHQIYSQHVNYTIFTFTICKKFLLGNCWHHSLIKTTHQIPFWDIVFHAYLLQYSDLPFCWVSSENYCTVHCVS